MLAVWQVDVELVEEWLMSIDQDSYEQVIAALELLQEMGPSLGRPLVDTVSRSRTTSSTTTSRGSREADDGKGTQRDAG